MYEEFLGLPERIVSTYTGYNVVFGYTIDENRVLRFNFLAFLAYFLPLIGGLLVFLRVRKYKILKFFVIGIIFMISSILLLTLTTYLRVEINIGQVVKRGAFPIIAGILAFLASLSSFYYSLIVKS
jgi:uncharacterized membrane protein HdeD (DUF308 family)